MPTFTCISCSAEFSIPDETMAKFPRWTPKYCKLHSPNRANGGGGGSTGSKSAASTSRPKNPSSARSFASASVEENLTVAEVLAKYTGGPSTGIFTDGACAPNPGPGGWGFVHVDNGEIRDQRYGHDADTTNNRMEMMALIEAFKSLGEDAVVDVYSDSKLCIQTLDEWAKGWAKNGWKRKQGEVKNLDLVKEAYALRVARPRVRLIHISAHSGNRWNEYADALSTAWRRTSL